VLNNGNYDGGLAEEHEEFGGKFMGWLKIRENIQHEKVGETKFGASKEHQLTIPLKNLITCAK